VPSFPCEAVGTSHPLSGHGVGRRKKSSSRQNSRHSVCRRQQRQSFRLVGNSAYRRIKAGVRTERHPHTHQPQRRHFGKDNNNNNKRQIHTAKFLKLGSTTHGYLTDQSSLNSTYIIAVTELLLEYITLLQ